MDPESKLLLGIDGGPRTLAMAQGVVHQVAQLLAPDCVPLLLSDGFKEDMAASLTHCGPWGERPRRQAPGPSPKPRWLPLPGLLYAQVIKTVRRWRWGDVTHRVVFGTLERVTSVLAACGWQRNTAVVECLNLTIHQHVAAVGRRGSTRCKGEDGVRHQRAVYSIDSHVCLPHASVRQALSQCVPTHGTGAATRWPLQSPARAAGLTDHVWTLREVLWARVPPWPQLAAL